MTIKGQTQPPAGFDSAEVDDPMNPAAGQLLPSTESAKSTNDAQKKEHPAKDEPIL